MYSPSKPLVEVSYRIRTWYEEPPAGVALEELLRPEAWVHRRKQLRPGNEIYVFAQDATYRAQLLVRSVEPEVHVAVLWAVQFDENIESPAPGYEIKWGSPSVNYRLLRVSDKHVMAENFPDKASAAAWAKKNLKTKVEA